MGRFDELEPWRAGGNNGNAGKPIVRYGPRTQDERVYQKQLEISYFIERFHFLKENIKLFNTSQEPSERQIAIEKISKRRTLKCKVYPDLKNASSLHGLFAWQCMEKLPERIYQIAERQLVIKKLFSEENEEYITEKVIPLQSFTLELRGYNKKEWQKSDLQIYLIFQDNKISIFKKIISFFSKNNDAL